MMIMMLTMMKLRSTMVTITNLRLRRLMVTLMRLRIKLMITGGGGGGGGMMIIKGRVTLTINKVKMLHAFFEERGRLYTPLTMMLLMMMMMMIVMMMITRMAKTIMMCQY